MASAQVAKENYAKQACKVSSLQRNKGSCLKCDCSCSEGNAAAIEQQLAAAPAVWCWGICTYFTEVLASRLVFSHAGCKPLMLRMCF